MKRKDGGPNGLTRRPNHGKLPMFYLRVEESFHHSGTYTNVQWLRSYYRIVMFRKFVHVINTVFRQYMTIFRYIRCRKLFHWIFIVLSKVW
jgi:hypothetical protein